MDKPLVSVVIVTRNRREELNRALISVYNQSYAPIEIIVLDNNSTDDTFKFITSNYPDVKLMHSEENLGCPGGRNKAVDFSNGEIIFFLDDDAWFGSNNILSSLVAKYRKGSDDIAVIMPNIMEYSINGNYLRYNYTGPTRLMTFAGGVSLIKRTVFFEFGPFPLTEYGSEEKYIAIKLFYNNLKIILYPDLIVHHKPSLSRDMNRIYYLSAYNDMLWTLTNCPYILIAPILIWKIFMWTQRSIKRKAGLSYLKGAVNGIIKFRDSGLRMAKNKYIFKFLQFVFHRKFKVKSLYSHR